MKGTSSISAESTKELRDIAFAAIPLFCALIIVVLAAHPARMDFIEYWSSAKLLIHHSDPYSPSSISALEKSTGSLWPSPLIMLNPPWALFLIAPLGFLGLRLALFLWIVAAAGSVFIFFLGTHSKDRAFTFVFAPVLAGICSGQSSPFLLLGFVLFLYFHRNRPFIAGAALLLMAIKPHLFLLFWVVLLVDCIHRRTFSILAGGISALITATAFSMYFDPYIWSHYFGMLRAYNIQRGFLPTASMLFRMLIDVRQFWLVFVPSAFAILWALSYYWRNRTVWDWRVHGMLLMVVTIFVSPYGFFSDEIVLLPSIIFALSLPQKSRYSAWLLIMINTAALYLVLANHAALSSRRYIWTPFAWLAWFLYTTRGRMQPETPSSRPNAKISQGVAGSIPAGSQS